MRDLLRNTEIKLSFGIYVFLSVLAVGGAFLYDRRLLLPALLLCAVFTFIHMYCIYIRYKRISKMSADIDRILHGDDSIRFENYSEGDIGLLQSEIYKMTVRLREQQSKLTEDKIYLADSLADISHQIRTPLTSINILVSMLSEPDLTYEKREQLIHKLYGLLSRIDWLITALLKMSKLDAGTIKFHSEDISIRDLLEKACMPVRVPMELRGQELIIEAEGDISCDVAWSCEAIGNIVKNCMEHTPEGGCISIKTEENAIYTMMVIEDTGTGFEKSDLENLFGTLSDPDVMTYIEDPYTFEDTQALLEDVLSSE